MNIITDILNCLTKLENSLTCTICEKRCVEPVRIKTCGHYFCSKCLEASRNDHNCPKCNEFYEHKHLDYDNIARSSETKLADLRRLLEQAQSINVLPDKTALCNSVKVTTPHQDVFVYNFNSYHLNFTSTVSKINAKGETLLHLACKKKKFNEVKELIKSKVDINAKDYAGWAPLHEAVQSQSLEIVEYILQKNCLVNIPGADYATPLHQAASLEEVDIVKVLLKYGADRHMVDYNGLKPEDYTKNPNIKDLLKTCHQIESHTRLFEVFLPKKIFLYCHTIDESTKKILENCQDIQVVNKVDVKKDLTHFMIKTTHKLSYKIMQAMLEGLQFLTEDCVEDYVKGNYFINIPEHTFIQNNDLLNEGIRKAMISALLKLPKLFDGINFYIEDHKNPIDVYHLKVDKEYLIRLIKAGGGKVLHRPPATRTCETEYNHPFFSCIDSGTYRCCNFIIFSENNAPDLLYHMDELQHRSSKWLIDCIMKYEISD